MFFFFNFNLLFGYKLVILIYFFFVNGEIKLTYLHKYMHPETIGSSIINTKKE